jgi:hypothetical protein
MAALIISESDYPQTLLCIDRTSTGLYAIGDRLIVLTQPDSQRFEVRGVSHICDMRSKIYILNVTCGIQYKVKSIQIIGSGISKVELDKIDNAFQDFSICRCC